jgi:TolA-binding protein
MGMVQRRRIFWLVFAGLMLFSAGFASAQQNTTQSPAQMSNSEFARRFQNGSALYGFSRFQEAAIEFRRAQESATNTGDWSRSTYWVIISQLAYSDFGSALRDMDELQRTAPNSTYARDMIYHRARVYYNQGFFEDALSLFNRYNTSTSDTDQETAARRAAAFFWMGECLYAMGQLDEAEKFYAWVIGKYPYSPKIEAAAYRVDLIKQKKIEYELLALLQWSHEESLKTSEDYQRTLRTYEHTLNVYQRRISELTSTGNISIPGEIEEPLPEIIKEVERIIIPEEKAPAVYVPSNRQERLLLERARELGNNVDEILRIHYPEAN